MKRIIIIASVLVVLTVAIVLLVNRQGKRTAKSIETAQVRKTEFTKVVSSSGKTAADRSVDLKFQTSGKLSWVRVKEGDRVAAYQAIAGMDSREVQKNLEKALRDYSSERNDFEETWRVTYQGRSNPNQSLNDTMKRILEKNQWDLEEAVLDVELKHLAVEYATLVSPIAGIVTHIDTPVAGVNITPATAVFTVSDPQSTVFRANVDETDVGELAVGQMATIMLDAHGEATFSGTISYISYTAEQSSGGATVFGVKITFDDPPETLRFGLNGDVSIVTRQVSDALVVPLEAVREDADGSYVYRKSGATYEKVRVTVGMRSEDEVIIPQGIDEGDTVVTKGFSGIPS